MIEQLARALIGRIGLGRRRTSVGASTFSSTEHCGSRRVVLEHEADVAVAKRRLRPLAQPNGSLPSSVTVPDVGGSSAPRM